MGNIPTSDLSIIAHLPVGIVGAGLAPALAPCGRPCQSHDQTQNLPPQNPPLPIATQQHPILSSKNPAVLPDATPVAAEEPITSFPAMAPARPGNKPLLNSSQ